MKAPAVWDDLDPVVQSSVDSQPTVGLERGCGCFPSNQPGDKWWLCHFHQGMQIGAKKVRMEAKQS